MSKAYSATDLPPSPDHERAVRVRNYLIAMCTRVACIIVLLLQVLWAPTWWMLIPAMGAIFLPYIAVVLANVGSPGENGTLESPPQDDLPPGAGPAPQPLDAPREQPDRERLP